MSFAKDYYSKETDEQMESCTGFKYLGEASDCIDKKDGLVSLSLDAGSGVLSISTSALIPDIGGGVNYLIVLNGETIHESSGNPIISVQHQGLEKLDGTGMKAPFDINVYVYNDNKTKGCSYNYKIESIERESATMTLSGESTYSFSYSPENTLLSLDQTGMEYIWKTNDQVVSQLSSSSETITDSILFLYTSEPDTIVELNIPSLGLRFNTGTIVIERNRYGINAKLSSVISLKKLYTNIIDVSVSNINEPHEIGLFINNQKMQESHFESDLNVGKKIQVVLSFPGSIIFTRNSFIKENTLEYFSYIEIEATDTMAKHIGEYTYNQFIDNISEDNILSSINPDKIISISKMIENNFASVDGENIIPSHESGHSGDMIITKRDHETRDREGRIFFINELMFVTNKYLIGEEVDIKNISNKKMIMVDEMVTSLLYVAEDVNAYFNVANSLIVDSQFGLMVENAGDQVELTRNLTVAESNLTQIEFYISFSKNFSSNASKAIVEIKSNTGSIIGQYGFEKNEDGNYIVHDEHGNQQILNQQTFSKQYVIELTTQMDIGYISLVMVDGKEDSLAINSLVLTERK